MRLAPAARTLSLALALIALLVVGAPAPARAQPAQPGEVFITQAADRQRATVGGEVNYTLNIASIGAGPITNAVVNFTVDPTVGQIAAVSFNRGGPAVVFRNSNVVQFNTGAMGSRSDSFSAFVRVTVLPQAHAGALLATGVNWSWSDFTGLYSRAGAALALPVDGGAAPQATLFPYPQSAPAGSAITFQSTPIFQSGEQISVWYTRADGASVSVGVYQAQSGGIFSLTFGTYGMAPGSYTMVAFGSRSQVTAVGPFTIT